MGIKPRHFFRDDFRKVLRPGMHLPEPIALLLDWIEARGNVIETPSGRVGTLYPDKELRARWTDTERPGGTIIELAAEGNAPLRAWFRTDDDAILDRLCVFAKTGAEGSMAAFWLDEGGVQRIVHLGSGSGSLMTCVLADDAVDFLRLLAIGYDEICWNDCLARPPNSGPDAELFVHPNEPYRRWVETTFATTIPAVGTEIVKHPVDMGDPESPDPFCRWVESVQSEDD